MLESVLQAPWKASRHTAAAGGRLGQTPLGRDEEREELPQIEVARGKDSQVNVGANILPLCAVRKREKGVLAPIARSDDDRLSTQLKYFALLACSRLDDEGLAQFSH